MASAPGPCPVPVDRFSRRSRRPHYPAGLRRDNARQGETHEAHSSYRVMPIAMATGQDAGVCAAVAAKADCLPAAVEAAAVQRELRAQGPTSARSWGSDRRVGGDPAIAWS